MCQGLRASGPCFAHHHRPSRSLRYPSERRAYELGSARCAARRDRSALSTRSSAMNGGHDYIRDGTAIYERSFAIIRAETDLSHFSREEADIVVRMVHACGSTDAAQYIQFGHGLVASARAALRAGAPILCDSEMVAHGVTRARLPASN